MPSMKCTVPGVNLKGFGRAIQCLSKIGDELYFEPLEDGLYLRSVNSSRSAFGSFQFSPSFFSQYVVGETDNDADSDEDVPRCKLGMKSIMAVFKSLPTIDKMVEKCRISLDSAEARLVFQMYCRHGIVKTHKLAFIECETLQAVFSKDMCPNKLTAVPKLLCDAVINFQNNQEEITLIMRPQFMALKNYVDDEPDPNKVIHTELTLSPEEFEHYQAGVDADITFCLKELRAILAFADIMGLPVTLHFESAGRPITFSITSDLSFEANFVLATLAEVESSEMSAAGVREQASSKTGSNDRRVNAAKNHSNHNGNSTNKNASSSYSRHPERHKNSTNIYSQSRNQPVHAVSQRDKPGPSSDGNDLNDNDEISVMFDVTAPDDSCISQQLPGAKSNKNINDSAPKDGRKVAFHDEDSDGWNEKLITAGTFLNPKSALTFKDADVYTGNEKSDNGDGKTQHAQLEAPTNSCSKRNSSNLPFTNRKFLSLKSTTACDDETSPVIPVQDVNLQSESDDDEEEIPVTPPSKKFRSVFFGTQSSTQSTQSQQKAVILAPDSDEDT